MTASPRMPGRPGRRLQPGAGAPRRTIPGGHRRPGGRHPRGGARIYGSVGQVPVVENGAHARARWGNEVTLSAFALALDTKRHGWHW